MIVCRQTDTLFKDNIKTTDRWNELAGDVMCTAKCSAGKQGNDTSLSAKQCTPSHCEDCWLTAPEAQAVDLRITSLLQNTMSYYSIKYDSYEHFHIRENPILTCFLQQATKTFPGSKTGMAVLVKAHLIMAL